MSIPVRRVLLAELVGVCQFYIGIGAIFPRKAVFFAGTGFIHAGFPGGAVELES